MTDPISLGQTPYTASLPSPVSHSASRAASSPLGDAAQALKRDSVKISQRAREAWLAQQSAPQAEEQAPAPTWQSLFGLSDGVKVLKNGHTQVTTIKGSELLVQEFDGDRLVRKETGSISASSVVKDIVHYDASGRVIRTTHSELTGLEEGGLSSRATLTRSAQWFEGGQLVRDYADSMTLSADYRGVPEFEPVGTEASELADLAGAMTTDGLATRFNATVSEYEDGTLRRSATVRQDTSLELATNRGGKARSGLPAHTTRELADGRQSAFSASVAAYDANGKLLHEASFSEEITPDAVKKQRLEAATYADGELVQRSSGTYEGRVPSGKGPNAQLLLDTLGLTQSEYSTTTPKPAAGLLAANFQEASDAPDFHVADAEGTNGQGYFGSARNLQSFQNTASPYSLTWTNEVYREGELAARQTDTEAAEKNHAARGLRFGTARGLAEDDSPGLLRSAEHTDESYDANGKLVRKATLERREEVVPDQRDVLRLRTRSRGSQSGSGEPVALAVVQQAPLSEVDPEARLASERFSAAAGLALRSASRLLDRLTPPDETDAA